MKLADHVEHIRVLIDNAFRNRLGRMGITATKLLPLESLSTEYHHDRNRLETILETLTSETGSTSDAYEKLVEEFTFTLFNRLAALKVMEAHTLHPEIITRRSQHGERSFSHMLWLEQNPTGRTEELEGLNLFIEDHFKALAVDIPLFSTEYPYHLLPMAVEVNSIIIAINEVEVDSQIDVDIWKSDDVLGWLYESYNNHKKKVHKESKNKTEFNKVSIQSQVYTPKWVVKFLIDNSLGKLYLEMFPESSIKEKYKIANAPKTQRRDIKPLTELRLIDPATGSGNFLLYGFDLFYDLYMDQINNYGADYDERKIPALIIHNNIFGVDLDDRAIQLAQLALFIKAKRKKRTIKIEHFNIVSSDFYLPEYKDVKHLFENKGNLPKELEELIIELWSDLQQAYKFGSLIMIEEKFSNKLEKLESGFKKFQIDIFESAQVSMYYDFRQSFFITLQDALVQNAERQGVTFLNTKTSDAISFMQILTQKYDVAVANPPYTDSSEFGPSLKAFLDANYKEPYKCNSNLYAAFVKRCCEIVNKEGKVALVHPPTFMYIKSFEDTRRYILDKMHISIFVEWGYLGMFNPTARVDSAMYVLEKMPNGLPATFIKLNNLYEGKRYDALMLAFDDLLSNNDNKYNYVIEQSKLKSIEGCPFIYWISDSFREKFQVGSLSNNYNIAQGLATANNDRFVRYWWEIAQIFNYKSNKDKWFNYSKGGPFNKWFGNNWAVVNWENNGFDIRRIKDDKGKQRSRTQNEKFYFKEGITYTASGSKGVSFRMHPKNSLFDVGGSCIFPTKSYNNLEYTIGLLNSKLAFYIIDCLNPTVNTQVGDLQRIPFVKPSKELEEMISSLAIQNIEIKKSLNTYRIFETNFVSSPIDSFLGSTLHEKLLNYLNFENALICIVILNEAIIDQLIYEVYDLNLDDRLQVEAKFGKSIGTLPVLPEAKKAFLIEINSKYDKVSDYVQALPEYRIDEKQIESICIEFPIMYQSSNDMESLCIRHQINPINIWYWFNVSKILPQGRATDIALEYLADVCRTILMDDEDGIIPLSGLPGESKLLDRIEQHCSINGIKAALFMQLEGLLNLPINNFIEESLFKSFSNHLNLYPNLPKTPFMWHLSSGELRGFEVYIIIYKWNRDSLFKLKTNYLNKRVENLEYRQIELAESKTAQAQSEKELIRMQLLEIANFTSKIDELISEGYDPKLDDGVGKNIAPLQKKRMLKCDILNEKQLEKYLKADW